MTMESEVKLVEHGDPDDTNDAPSTCGSKEAELEPVEDESEEDEDVDFNPMFLKESLSDDEASSSLSSEVEVLDADVVGDSDGGNQTGDRLRCSIGDSKADDEVSREGECGGKQNKGETMAISFVDQGNGTVQDKDNGSSSGSDDVVGDSPDGQKTMTSSQKPTFDLDDEDAICKRTRARYSLAGFTLDELETFLQETDDDDDFQNVDEEEEYRKFLAAVLQGGNGDDQGNMEGNGDADDDDEDNDADFEIEIEEALESDVDDCIMKSNDDEEFARSSRRPETRRNRRRKASVQNKKNVAEVGKIALRPLLPIMPNSPVTSIPCMGVTYLTRDTSHFPSSVQDHMSSGFMAHQVGQLYCLIYEHVQLLIQIYSLCVLEPSRQHVASELKGLLSEMLHKRDLVLAWRKVPYPKSCFLPQYVHASVSDEIKSSPPVEESGIPRNDGQGCRWVPSLSGPVLSVLDVAPLNLVGRYIDDVSNAVREHQRRCVESANIFLEKQPLFPLPVCPFSEVNRNSSKGDNPTSSDASAASQNPNLPKKTLAATLVESTKTQSVALVHRLIAKLAQPFYSLFNPALFPHKPPSSSVANRVLFTDTEDELLAMGIMEYNNNWKYIRQRFLPCKTEHQIFVRAKNRSSSKAPENPIKAVRKMKTSPLTEEEKTRIDEGLNTFKLDWTSIWKFIVPHRDPNLLSRQWRIAAGIQKSYKGDSRKKEKHRIYELNRRRGKSAALESSTGPDKEDNQTEYPGGQNGSGEDCVDNDNEAYLHEAFLADWRPMSSGMISSKVSASRLKSGFLPGDISAERCCDVQEGTDDHGNQEFRSENGCTNEVSTALQHSRLMHCKSFQPCMPLKHAPSNLVSKPFVSEALLPSHRTRRRRASNLVKLAPDLPPVKLPPAVRVIRQAFPRISQHRSTSANATAGSEIQNTACDPTVMNCNSNLVKPAHDSIKIGNPSASSKSPTNCELLKNGCLTEERGPDFDPQMHPLLFQALEEGHLPYTLNSSSSMIPTFSFFPVPQPQINVSLLQNPTHGSPLGCRLNSLRSTEITSTSSCLDFHPLLQKTNDINVSSMAAGPSGTILSTDLELSRDGFTEEDIVYRAGAVAAQKAAATRTTGPCADANGLDLDMHLSSASKRRKVASCEGNEVNLTGPSARETGFVEGAKERTDIQYRNSQRADDHLVAPLTSGHTEITSSAHPAPQLPDLGGSSGACSNDNVSDQPLVGIVMEQEELSDTDEEMEGVEFECEEMEDSEGEGSDNDEIVNAQNKDHTHSALGTDSYSEHSESVLCGASERIQAQRKGRTPRSESMGRGKGDRGRSWLSLNSRGSRCSLESRNKSTHSFAKESPTSSHRSKHWKVTMSTKYTPSYNLETDSPPSRKSKKRTSKITSPLRTDVSVVNAHCTDGDRIV